MKYTLLYLTLVCFSFGCKDMHQKEKPNIDMLVFGKDTIVITGYFNMDFTKLDTGYHLHGYWDSTKAIFYTEIDLNPNSKSQYTATGNSQQNINTGSGSQVITNK